MNRKKLLTSVTAVALALVLALGGTFAWQSINQTALNVSSDDVNPGGRLHDDFDGSNKDVYVENFADEPIFARIRLREYFEVVMNYQGAAETTETVIGTRGESTDAETGEPVITRTGDVFNFDQRVAKNTGEDGKTTITVSAGKDPAVTDSDYYWWTWTMGSADSDAAYYMPTFNRNKDSLVADVNGKYAQPGVITSQDVGQYTGYVPYDADSTKTGIEIYDADRNSTDEVGEDFDNLDTYVTAENIKIYRGEEHTAKEIGKSNGFISMAEWLALGDYSAETHGGYWVYDTDGWVYWSSPIAAGDTTGRLLDGIEMNHVMDDSWYYKLTVEAQFVTADDVGKEKDTGFYKNAGEEPTADAKTLLSAIGVVFPGADADQGDGDNTDLPRLQLGFDASAELSQYDKVVLLTDGGGYPADSDDLKLTTDSGELTKGTDYAYSGSNGILTLLTDAMCEITVTYAQTQTATIYANDYKPGESTAQTHDLTLKNAEQIQSDMDIGMSEEIAKPSVSAEIGDTVNIDLLDVETETLMEGYTGLTTDASIIGKFTINGNTYSADSWSKTTPTASSEKFDIQGIGDLTLNYAKKTIQFVPDYPAITVTIVVKYNETEYTGDVKVGTVPSTGPIIT